MCFEGWCVVVKILCNAEIAVVHFTFFMQRYVDDLIVDVYGAVIEHVCHRNHTRGVTSEPKASSANLKVYVFKKPLILHVFWEYMLMLFEYIIENVKMSLDSCIILGKLDLQCLILEHLQLIWIPFAEELFFWHRNHIRVPVATFPKHHFIK